MKTQIYLNNKSILVTGSPGFIGANLVLRLLGELEGGHVISFDNMNDYYAPSLKEYRMGLIDELIGTTKCKDREVLEMLLAEAGYHCTDGHYVFDQKLWEDILNGLADKEDPWEVDYVLYNYESVASELAIINRSVSAVKYLSDPAAIKCCNEVRHLADQLRHRWPNIICRGTQLRYLRIRKNVKSIDEDMQALIQRDVDEVSVNAQNLLAEYYDAKRVNDDFNPPHAG